MAMAGYVYLASSNQDTFINSRQDDMVITTSSNTQNILLGTTVNATSVMTITSNFVGIQNSNPRYPLDMIGSLVVKGSHYGTSNDTSALPTFSFVEDSNTGMFHASNDAIGFTTAGTERVRITDIGYVGIGVQNPAYALDVLGSINMTGALTQNGGPISSSRWTPSAQGIYVNSNVGIAGPASSSAALMVYGSSLTMSNLGQITLSTSNNALGVGTITPTEQVQVTGKFYSQTQILGTSNDTVTVPSFSFKENSNTGMFHAAADTLGFTTAGTEKMRIDSGGYVGIGTTAPNTALSVQGTNAASVTIQVTNLSSGTGAASAFALITDQAGYGGYIFKNSTTRSGEGGPNTMTMRNDGGMLRLQALGGVGTTKGIHIASNTNYVGIGTSTPSYLLDVAGGARVGDLTATGNWYWSPNQNMYATAGANNQDFTIDLINQNTYTGCYWGVTSDKGAITILSARGDTGYVGVNTSAPSETLHTVGKIYTTTQFLSTSNDSVTVPSFSFKEDSNTGIFHAADDTLGFSTGGIEKVRITSAGNVGIMNNNPQYALDVVGGARFTSTIYGDGSGLSNLNATYLASGTIASNLLPSIPGLTPATYGSTVTVPQITVDAKGRIIAVTNVSVNTIAPFLGSVTDTSATPSFTWTGDTNTGMFHPTACNIAFTTGSSEKVRITSTGNVGINNTAPNYPLDVTGDMNVASNLRIAGQIVANSNQFLGNATDTITSPAFTWTGYTTTGMFRPAADTIGFTTLGTEKMRISSAGNVGIGTTAPNAPLQFSQAAVNRKIVLYEGTNNDHQYLGFGVNANVLRYQVTQTGASHIFYAGTSPTTSTELMRIAGTGYVGINNAAPATSLDVIGIINANVGTGSNAFQGLNNALTNGQSISIMLGQSNGASNAGVIKYTHYGAASSNMLQIGMVGQTPTAMTILANANTGIMTSNPIAPFHVYGQMFVGDSAYSTIAISNTATKSNILIFDNIHDSTATTPANKIRLFNLPGNSVYGFGISANQLNYHAGVSHVFYTGTTSASYGSEIMRVASTSRVGIVNSSPNYPLDVTGDINTTTALRIGGTIMTNTTQHLGISTDSVSAPAFTWTGYTTTGIYRPAADTIGFTTLATERVRISSTGNMGIGTNNPYDRLHVNAGDLIISRNSNVNNVGGGIHGSIIFISTARSLGNSSAKIMSGYTNPNYDDCGYLSFVTSPGADDGIERMRITEAGNIGIGLSNPNAPLQFVNTNVNRKIVLWETANNDHQIHAFGVNSNVLRYQIDATTSSHVFYTGASSSTSTELMRITGTGRVGINNASPNYPLDVIGDINTTTQYRIAGNIIADSTHFLGSASDSISTPSYSWTGDTNTGMFRPGSQIIAFTTAGTERMRINNTSVGIGKNPSASFILDVNGNISGSYLALGTGGVVVNRFVTAINSAYANAGANAFWTWGGADSAYNATEIGYHHVATGSLSNYLILGMHSKQVMFLNAYGNVGVGITTPLESFQSVGKIYTTVQFLSTSNDSVTAPSYSFYEDSNTGMFHASNDTIGFSTAGAERMRIDSSGYVGISTTTPAYYLDVLQEVRFKSRVHLQEAASTQEITFGHLNSAAGGDFHIFDVTNSRTLFGYFKTSNVVSILNPSAVGIGMTNPSYKLDVAGDINLSGNLRTGGVIIANTTQHLGNATDSISTPAFTWTGDTNTGIYHPAADTIGFTIAGTEKVRIGTGSCNLILKNGDVNNGFNLSQIELDYNGGGFPHYIKTRHNGVAGTGNSIDFHVWPDSNNTNPTMSVTSTSVGISTASPIAPLHVYGQTFIGDGAYNTTALGNTATKSNMLIFDNVYDSTATTPANKIRLYNTTANVYGFGISAGQLNYHSIHHVFHVNTTSSAYGTEVMRVANTSRVGILNSSPNYPLDVTGDINTTTNIRIGGNIVANSTQFLGNAADSVTVPSFTWTGDTNTGMYKPAPDSIGFTIAGIEAMRINSNGFIGIGDSNPLTALDMNGTISVNVGNGSNAFQGLNSALSNAQTISMMLGNANTASNAGVVQYTHYGTASSNMLQVGIVGQTTPAMTVLANGNVGFGTTTPNATIQLSNILANRRIVLWDTNNNDHQFFGLGIQSGILRYQVAQSSTDSHVFYAGATTSTSTELMRITGTGYVGIGTTPHAQLQFANTVVNRKIVLYESFNDDHRYFGFGINGGILRYQVDGNNSHVFYASTGSTTSVELARITSVSSVGRIGINNSAPGYPLDVTGDINLSGSIRVGGTIVANTYQHLGTATDSVTVPAFSWTGDTNTGIYQPAACNIGFTTGGTEMMRIAYSNVGIGINPTFPLQVSADAALRIWNGTSLYPGDPGQAQLILCGKTDNTKRLAFLFDTTCNVGHIQSMKYGTGTMPLCLQRAGGGVGIATETPAYTLDVAGTVNTSTAYRIAGNIIASTTQIIGTASDTVSAPAFTWTGDLTTGMFRPAASTIGFTAASGEKMRVTSTGRVGIMNTNPGYPLDVTGDINTSTQYRIGGTTIATSTQFLGNAADTASAPAFTWTGDTNTGIFHPSNNVIAFTSLGSEKARITGGNFGIGTTAPLYKLDVNGSARLAGNTILYNNANTAMRIMSGSYWNVSGTNYYNIGTLSTDANGGNGGACIIRTHTGSLAGGYSTSGYLEATISNRNGLRTHSIFRGCQPTATATKILLYQNSNLTYSLYLCAPFMSSFDIEISGGSLVYVNQDWQSTQSPTDPGSNASNAVLIRDFTAKPEVTQLWGGNFGIGHSNPAYPLDVIGDINTSTILRINNTTIATSTQHIGNSADSITVPAFTWTGDLTTGMFRPAANTIGFTAAGGEKMRVTSTGRVGIMNTAPNYPLDVTGDINTSTNLRVGGSIIASTTQFLGIAADSSNAPAFSWTGDTNTGMYKPAADNIGFSIAGVEKVRIGTGACNLILKNGDTAATYNLSQIEFDWASGGYSHYIKTRHNTVAGTGNSIDFHVWPDVSNTNPTMSVTSTYVGIGISTPAYPLHVTGDINSTTQYRIGGTIIATSTQLIGTSTDTVSAPAFTWTGDLTTGMFRPGANTIGFTAAGGEKMRVTSTGRVGIMNTNPAYTLDVTGETQINGALVLQGGTTSYNLVGADAGNLTNTYLAFGPAGATSDAAYLRQIGGNNSIQLALDFHDDGNDSRFVIRDVASVSNPDTITTRFAVMQNTVGINTASPAYALDVVGDINTTIQYRIAGNIIATSTQFLGNAADSSNAPAFSWSGDTNTGIYRPTTDTIGISIAGTEKLRITTAGNLGIGTTTPNAPLQFSQAVANRKIVMYENANNDHEFFGFGINGAMLRYQVSATNSCHAFYTGTGAATSTEIMRITGTGFVGIGTASPNAPLQFANTLANRKIVLYEATNNDHQYFGFGINGNILRYQVNTTTDSHVFYTGTGTTTSAELMRLTGTGKLGINNAAPVTTLDVMGTISANVGNGSNAFQGLNNALTNGQAISMMIGQSNGASNAGFIQYTHYSNVSSNMFQMGITGQIVPSLTMLASGYTGIMSSNPIAPLHVYGQTFIGDKTWYSTLSGNTLAKSNMLVFDGYFDSTATTPANKIRLANDATWIGGFGVSASQMNYHSGNHHVFYFGTTSASYGTEVMRVTSTSRMGILNSSPNYTLDVTGDINTTTNLRIGGTIMTSTTQHLGISTDSVTVPAFSWTGDTNTGMYHPALETIAFTNNGLESMRINSNGFIGIAKTTPLTALDMNGTISVNVGNGSNAFQGLNSAITNGQTINMMLGSANTASNAALIRYNHVGAAGANTFQLGMVGQITPAMTILANGNIGINNAAPAYTLDVTGMTRFISNCYFVGGVSITPFQGVTWIDMPISGPSAIGSGGAAGSNAWIAFTASAGQWFTSSLVNDICYRNVNGRLLFGNSTGAHNFAITSTYTYSANSLGIGTASPNAPLQFANTTVSRKIVLYESANNDNQVYSFGVNTGVLRYQIDGTIAAHVFYAGTGTSTSAELMRIAGTGKVGINNTAPATTLDVIGTISANVGNSSNAFQGLNSAITNGQTINMMLGSANTASNAGVIKYTHYGAASSNMLQVGIVGQTVPAMTILANNTINFTGIVNANGAGISNLNASYLTTGTVASNLLPTIPGITPATYGSTTTVPQIVVDSFGRITSVTNVGITGSYTTFLGSATDTVTTPSFTWTGDTNTGIYKPALDTIGFTAAGIETMRINSNGFIGIAKTTPLTALDMNGTISVNVGNGSNAFQGLNSAITNGQTINMMLGSANTASNAALIRYNHVGAAGANMLQIGLVGQTMPAMTVLANGNVGFGTTTPNAQIQLSNITANRSIVLWDANNNDHQFVGLGVNTNILRYQVASTTTDNHVFYAGATTSTSTELMRIKGTGNVGIGTAAPNAPLQFANTTVNRKIVLWETTNNDHQYYGFGINNTMLRYQVEGTASYHAFFAGTGPSTSVELARIAIVSGVGRIGINNNPGYPLDVTGDINTTTQYRIGGNIVATSTQFLGTATDSVSAPAFSWSGNANTGIYRPLANCVAVTTNGTQRLFINNNGYVQALGMSTMTYMTRFREIYPVIATPTNRLYGYVTTLTQNQGQARFILCGGGADSINDGSQSKMFIDVYIDARINIIKGSGYYHGLHNNTKNLGLVAYKNVGTTNVDVYITTGNYTAYTLEVHNISQGTITSNVTWSTDTAWVPPTSNLQWFDSVTQIPTNSINNTFYVTPNSNITYAITQLNSGYVGMGNSNPLYPLDVTGDINTTTNLRMGGAIVLSTTQHIGNAADSVTVPAFTWSGDLNTGMFHPATDVIAFTTNGVERARITSTGDIQMSTSNAIVFTNNDAGKRIVLWDAGGGAYNGIGKDTSATTFAVSATNNFFKFVAYSGSTPNEVARLTGTGNFGINNNNPTVALDVTGDIRASGHWYWAPIKNCYCTATAINQDFSVDLTNMNTYTGCTWQVWTDKTGQGGSLLVVRGDTGNVGVKTTSPAYNLDVVGDINASANLRIAGNVVVSTTQHLGVAADSSNAPAFSWTGDVNTGMYRPTTQTIGFTTAGTERMRITNSYVGIGLSNPSALLHVNGSTRLDSSVVISANNTATLLVGSTTTFDTDAVVQMAGVASTRAVLTLYNNSTSAQAMLTLNNAVNTRVGSLGTVNNILNIQAGSSATTAGINFINSSSTSRMFINTYAGSVGINNGSPNYALDVTGDINTTTQYRLAGNIIATSTQFLGIAADSSNAPAFSWSGDTNTGIYKPAADTIGFTIAGSEKVRITTAGYVGIGKAAPNYPLHVGIASNNISICADYDVVSFSDIRLKTDLAPITDALNKVMQINGYTFRRIDSPVDRRQCGVIAQEVEKVLPEVVNDDGTTKNVAYGNMVALLIEAIKEMKQDYEAKINKQEEQFTALHEQFIAQEKRIIDLETKLAQK